MIADLRTNGKTLETTEIVTAANAVKGTVGILLAGLTGTVIGTVTPTESANATDIGTTVVMEVNGAASVEMTVVETAASLIGTNERVTARTTAVG